MAMYLPDDVQQSAQLQCATGAVCDGAVQMGRGQGQSCSELRRKQSTEVCTAAAGPRSVFARCALPRFLDHGVPVRLAIAPRIGQELAPVQRCRLWSAWPAGVVYSTDRALIMSHARVMEV